MAIEFVPFEEKHIQAVRAFNERLKDGGSTFSYPMHPVTGWIPPAASAEKPYQQCFIATDDDGAVRGGYIYKPQDFMINSHVVEIADLRLPLSEGSVNRKYNYVGFKVVANILKKNPLIFGMGMGGHDRPIVKLFKALGFTVYDIPFFFRVLNPRRFFKNITVLRSSAARRLALDMAALLPPAWLAVNLFHKIKTKYRPGGFTVWEFTEFGPWADELWRECAVQASLVAVRNQQVLRRLYPSVDKRFIRLSVLEQGKTAGWMVLLCTQMDRHKQFGSMRIGSIVDCMASDHSAAAALINGAARVLRQKNADLIVTNQSLQIWQNALTANGFLQGPTNYLFATSKELSRMIGPLKKVETFHINRGDGDGPINL